MRQSLIFAFFAHQIVLALIFSTVLANNIATEQVTYLHGPVTQPSQFGYSIVVHRTQGNLTLWVGSPKYSISRDLKSSPKQGAIFKCRLKDNAANSSNEMFHCSTIDLKTITEETKKEKVVETNLPLMALESCNFETQQFCGFTHAPSSDFNWTITKRSGLFNKFDRHLKKYCFSSYSKSKSIRLTGPPSYTVNDYYLNADSANANARKQATILVSPAIKTQKGLVQCLRFCFNAFAKRLSAKRLLDVWIQYEDVPKNLKDQKHSLFSFSRPTQRWSIFWNHTEVNIQGLYDSTYKIYFKATVYHARHKIPICRAQADIALTDINVSNMPCEEEESEVDAITKEQSIGLNLETKMDEDEKVMSLASCGALWQQNCGYAREANGVCYEMEVEGSRVRKLTRHNPVSKECIRGKIDIVLVVDQSGSVNHCNFQKVKRWLRNIVRGFNLGKNQQDIGVIVYSSADYTRVVVPLGFEGHLASGSHKKADTVRSLRNLPFKAGLTYTGYALKTANELLFKARPDSKKLIILLTDGATTFANRNELRDQTAIARARNTTILAVGVGSYKEEELLEIAGNRKNFFAVKKFSELDKIRDKLRSSVSLGALEGGSIGNQTAGEMQQCQMGFAVHYSKDAMLMGSPGCYRLSGNVIAYRPSSLHNESAEGSAFEVLQKKFMTTNATFSPFTSEATPSLTTIAEHDEEEYADEEKNVVSSHLEDYEIPTISDLHQVLSDEMSDSYLGYSVTSGYYFGTRKEYVAASAPRFQGRGAVLIYHSFTEKRSSGRGYLLGQQFGEYFGAALCSEDLNGDNYTDLLVGAPLHIASQPDEGRVYVYMGGESMSQNASFTLAGTKTAFARFGSYIAAVGDLNMDGFKDVAVSAPLERNGVIYIFYGEKDGISPTFVQKIDPLILTPKPSSPLKRFGQTIVGDVDVDLNGYPDLIVGSPGNDTLAILLSRPVIYVSVNITATESVDARSEACQKRTSTGEPCLFYNVCFYFTGVSIPSLVAIDYNLDVDVEQHPSRFSVVGQHTAPSSVIQTRLSLYTTEQFYCRNHSFTLKPYIRDEMSPIVLKLDFRLAEKDGHHSDNSTSTPAPMVSLEGSGSTTISSPVIMNYTKLIMEIEDAETRENAARVKSDLNPIMDIRNTKQATRTIFFKTYCQRPANCRADMSLDANVTDRNGNKITRILIGKEKVIRLRFRVVNNGPENAHDASIDVTYPNVLFISTLRSVAKSSHDGNVLPTHGACFELSKKEAEKNENETKTAKILLKPTVIKKDEICEMDLIFGLSSSVDPYVNDEFSFIAKLDSLSHDTREENNNASLSLTMRYAGKIDFSGYSSPHLVYVETNSSNLPKKIDEIRSNSSVNKHLFTISNVGHTAFRHVEIGIKWPAYRWSGAHRFDFFYIKGIYCFTGTLNMSCSCEGRNLTDPYQIFQPEKPSLPARALDLTQSNTVEESITECGRNRSDCYTNIICDIRSFAASAMVSLKIEWIAFPNSFSGMKSAITLSTSATSRLFGGPTIVMLDSSREMKVKVANTLTPLVGYNLSQGKADVFKLPWWVYLFSALAGLLLLILLGLALKRLGFFESKYAKMKKEEEQRQQDEAATPLQA